MGFHRGLLQDITGGYFIASTGVRSASTDSAVMEFVKDIHLYNDKGISDEELEFTKNSIGLSDARKYETNAQKAGFLAHIQEYDLKPDLVTEENAILSGITKEQIDELAKKYLNPDVMSILIVGDKDKIAPGLQQLGYKVIELDTDGEIK
jgi:zinc protease